VLKGGARSETVLFYISERWRRNASIEDEDDDDEYDCVTHAYRAS
jgi:hypothetical protein